MHLGRYACSSGDAKASDQQQDLRHEPRVPENDISDISEAEDDCSVNDGEVEIEEIVEESVAAAAMEGANIGRGVVLRVWVIYRRGGAESRLQRFTVSLFPGDEDGAASATGARLTMQPGAEA